MSRSLHAYEYECQGKRIITVARGPFANHYSPDSIRIIKVENGEKIEESNEYLGTFPHDTELYQAITWCARCLPGSTRACDKNQTNKDLIGLEEEPISIDPQTL